MSQIASDDANNYGGANPWEHGSNGGSGFGTWTITTGTDGGNAGAFLGDPTAAAIDGLPDPSFGLFANPAGSNFVNADREFDNPMPEESTFSFDWGVNWDSGGSGNKGFNLYVGGTGGTEVININQGNSATITINGDTMFSEYGTQAMTLHFEYQGDNTLRVYGIGRDGIESYDETFNITGAPDAFRFYASNLAAGDERQPYFNNFLLEESPLPVAFTTFRARVLKDDVHLDWSYEATQDFDRLIVEHSADTEVWSEIHRELADEEGSLSRHAASTVHRTPMDGVNYYRLRAIGRSGDERLSPIRMVRIERSGHIRLINTTVDRELIVERSSMGERATLLVTDGKGRVVQTFELPEGEGRQTFNLNNLLPGMYFLAVDAGGQQEVFKFVKM